MKASTLVLNAIARERVSQNAKWGEQNHDDLYWLGILVEEVGEVAKCVVEKNAIGTEVELTQAAAVCIAWMECVERRIGRTSIQSNVRE